MMSKRLPNDRSFRAGFTLIELLVVISIIALLISILLPALASARRIGQRVTCLADMKSMSSGMTEYEVDNESWIVGSPAGSGAYLFQEPTAWGQSVQRWDFMGPLAKLWGMGLTQPDRGDREGVAKRFAQLVQEKVFLCPSNKFLATHFGGPDAGTLRMVSYNTTRYELFQSEPPFPGDAHGVSWYANTHDQKLPNKWKPSVGRIGNPANKVFCADGARFSTGLTAPDYDLRVNAAWGGAFSDVGPYSDWTRSWDRSWAPGNDHGGTIDARAFAFRHSTADPGQGAPADAYKLNLAFYDGHAETMGDLQASSPQLWLPAGSTLEAGGALIYPDTQRRFGVTGTVTIGP
ncbi:MAG: type II secretion system protein [Phycisphaerae bacterium]